MLPECTDIAELPEEARTRCEVWTRVMGYHRPVAAWNPGKQSEHADRRFYREALNESPAQSDDRCDVVG